MDFNAWVRQQWDRFAGWVSIAVGAIAMLLGWLGVTDTAYPAEQLPYILSGGVFGLFLLGLGGVLLLSADLRDEWRKLDDIEEAIRSSSSENAVTGSVPPAADAPAPASRNGARARPIAAR